MIVLRDVEVTVAAGTDSTVRTFPVIVIAIFAQGAQAIVMIVPPGMRRGDVAVLAPIPGHRTSSRGVIQALLIAVLTQQGRFVGGQISSPR